MSEKKSEKAKVRMNRAFLLPVILISTAATLCAFILVGVLTNNFLIGAVSAAAVLAVTIVIVRFVLKKRVPENNSGGPDSKTAVYMQVNELRKNGY